MSSSMTGRGSLGAMSSCGSCRRIVLVGFPYAEKLFCPHNSTRLLDCFFGSDITVSETKWCLKGLYRMQQTH